MNDTPEPAWRANSHGTGATKVDATVKPLTSRRASLSPSDRLSLLRQRGIVWGLPWFAIATGIAGCLLSLLSWRALTTYEASEVRGEIETTSSDLSHIVESGLAREYDAFRDLARFWGEFRADDRSRWELYAKLFLKGFDDFIAIEWDPTMQEISAPLTAGTVEGLDLLTRIRGDESLARKRMQAMAAGVELLHEMFNESSSSPVYEVIVPVPREQAKPIFLVGLTKPRVSIERILVGRARRLPLLVTHGETVLLRRGEFPALTEDFRISQKALSIRQGDSWMLSVFPSPSMVGINIWSLSSVVLILGLVISVLLTLIVRMSQSSTERANELLVEDMERRMGELEFARVDRQRRQLEAQIAGTQQEVQRLRLEQEMLTREVKARANDLAPAHQTGLTELEAFNYSVSHDLRSPLGAIMNYAAVLTEDYGTKLGAEGCEHLERIAASAQTAVSMMDGLLAFSRAGRAELKSQNVDMERIVREVYEELCHSEGQRFPDCKPTLTMGSLRVVHGDPILLRVLLANLLSNAFKFMRKVKDKSIEVGGYVQGEFVVIYVKDSGIGFDMKNAQKLFSVFERLHTKDEYEGHGIGLALVERIARRHGGSVRAEGAVGKGATFFVTLPHRTRNDP